MACLIIRHRSKVGHPRAAIRSVGFVFRVWSFVTNLAAQCCTRLLICVVVWGFHVGDEYSSFGLVIML